MKNLKLAVLIIISLSFVGIVNAGNLDKTKGEKAKKEIYYFHNTKRCVTCKAIETETKKVLSENYADEVKKGEIVFKDYNAEESANKAICKEMGVSGSALIVVNGDKKTDLTSKGFMYALKQPEKLHEAIIEALK